MTSDELYVLHLYRQWIEAIGTVDETKRLGALIQALIVASEGGTPPPLCPCKSDQETPAGHNAAHVLQ